MVLSRWRCRAPTCMPEAISPRRAGCQPITLPNGTGVPGRPWVRGWMVKWMRWRCRAPTCLREAHFTTAGGVATTSIAQWNGSSWTALGSEEWIYLLYALAVSGTNLYAGGLFYQVFDNNYDMHAVVANGIAQWNGSSWTNLGSGMDSVYRQYSEPTVCALAVSGTNLYAGGSFTSAGGAAATNIAEWNGSSWTNLGPGLGVGISGTCALSVAALAVSGTNLYAAGCFTNAGETAVNYIALWDGSSWSALGSGTGPGVSALAVSGNTLYAGGYFTNAGGVPVNYIAQAIYRSADSHHQQPQLHAGVVLEVHSG